MQTLEQKLSAVESSRRRWLTRLKRATNMLAKLDQQTKRLKTKQTLSKVLDIAKAEVTADRLPPVTIESALDIPTELKRDTRWLEMVQRDDTEADLKEPEKVKTLKAVLTDPAAEVTRIRLAKNDAKRRGYKLEPDKKAMPLSGRDALKFLKSQKKK